ncbi:RNA-binding protein [Trypanosoma grayi]|uniref:RNA-binding protein n=1 Tax=Trypanosoma grayi TaxID=71804 RepID=UPI0004F416A5|nr:RNA-binding protein [Trypanosoma grayi]KEG09873.1 RNA-binding protein [Trypanosoma grayi]
MLSNVENFNHASFFPPQQGATDAVDVAHEENIKNTDKSPIGLPTMMVEKHTDSQLALALDSCMSPFSRSASSNIIEPQLRQSGKEGSYADESLWIGEANLSMTASGTSWLVTPADSLLSGAAKGNNLNQATPGSDAPRLSARNNVYVSELPLHWNTDKLRSVCLAFGNIVSAKVVHDSATNRSREYGFVMFESEEQAALCVRSLNNCLMDGKILTCRLAHERAMPSFANTDRVAWSTSPSTPSPAIGFATPQQQALESMPLLKMRSTEESAPLVSQPLKPALSVSVSKRGSSSLRRSRNVFLQGLPLHWNTDKLRSLCGTFGKVELAKVVRDATTTGTQTNCAACAAHLAKWSWLRWCVTPQRACHVATVLCCLRTSSKRRRVSMR